MGTVAIVHKCTIMYKLMCVIFSSNGVKSTTFFILHNYDRADVIALKVKIIYIYIYLYNRARKAKCDYVLGDANQMREKKGPHLSKLQNLKRYLQSMWCTQMIF